MGHTRFGLIGSALLAFAAVDAAGQPAAPAAGPAAPSAEPADAVVLSRIDNTQAVESSDLRLVLTKAKREEHALLRRLIFISATLRLTQPAAAPEGDAAPAQTCRWAYRAFLQRQVCFTSMTGLLSCTEAEVIPLPDEAHGEAQVPDKSPVGVCNDAFRPAVNARVRLSSGLLGRSKDLFAADRAAKIDPVFKAAGVTVDAEPPPAPRPVSVKPAG